jgi:hypothetical protein
MSRIIQSISGQITQITSRTNRHLMAKSLVVIMYCLCYSAGRPNAADIQRSTTMIAADMIAEVRRLLAEKRLSQREIAKRTGVSRGTVSAVASGKRRKGPRPLRSSGERGGFRPPTGMPTRCRGCGALTQMPCLACYIRARCEARKPARGRPCQRPSSGTIAVASCG